MQEKARILVVDDDPDAVELLEEILADEGYSISKAADGDSAIQAFRSGQFDLVISDVRMPGKHGFSLLEEVKTACSDVPVILVTGYPTDEGLLDSVFHRAYAYVEKPFDVSYLLSLIKKALSVRPADGVRGPSE